MMLCMGYIQNRHPKILPDKDTETIFIAGGGVVGCLTAYVVSLIKRADGKPKYHVIISDKQKQVLNGACATAQRLHFGGEYPHSLQTALDCIRSAIIWKLTMPDGIYTSRPGMTFSVAEATEKSGKLTIESYLEHYEKIFQEYKRLFRQVQTSFGWTPEHTAEKLFGPPERELFYRRLNEVELAERSLGAKLSGACLAGKGGLRIAQYRSMDQLQGQRKRH